MGRYGGVMLRGAAVLIAVASIWLGVTRWIWYMGLPRYSSARICGNCFLTAVGIPLEIALMGGLVAIRTPFRIGTSRKEAYDWVCAALGILLTPLVIGVPAFVLAMASLAWSTASRAFGAWSGREA